MIDFYWNAICTRTFGLSSFGLGKSPFDLISLYLFFEENIVNGLDLLRGAVKYLESKDLSAASPRAFEGFGRSIRQSLPSQCDIRLVLPPRASLGFDSIYCLVFPLSSVQDKKDLLP